MLGQVQGVVTATSPDASDVSGPLRSASSGLWSFWRRGNFVERAGYGVGALPDGREPVPGGWHRIQIPVGDLEAGEAKQARQPCDSVVRPPTQAVSPRAELGREKLEKWANSCRISKA
jgi:hypothetical protein